MKKIFSFLFGGDIWMLFIKWGGIVMLAWALGKILGIIHSPLIIEVVPYIGGGFGLLGIGMRLGRILERIDNIQNNLNDVKSQVSTHETMLHKLETRLHKLEVK